MRQPPLRVPRSSGTWGSVNSPRTKKYWGTQRVARVCQVSPATVASWIDAGHLKGHKTPTGRRRVESTDLVEFLRSHGMAVPPDLLAAGLAGEGGGGGGGGEAGGGGGGGPVWLRGPGGTPGG